MNGNKSVTANFVQRHLVTHEVVYDGYITPAGGLRDHGVSVSFNRKKHNRHEEDFEHWSGLPESFSTPEWGVGTSTSNPVSFVVEGPHHLKAYDETQIVTLTANVDASGCVECTVDPEERDGLEAGILTTGPNASEPSKRLHTLDSTARDKTQREG